MKRVRESRSQGKDLPPVLVVDDIDANLVALEALLQGLGCEVVLANSGDQALRQLLKHDFAVALLDVQMPDMDGYEVAQHARQNPATRDVPIIFVTAMHNTEATALRGYGSGAVDFLFKPVDPEILRSKVRVFLELYAGRRLLRAANLKLEARNSQLATLAEAQTLLAEDFRQANASLQQAYRDLQTAQSQLVQTAKMASLGNLVAGVAHEINNPLSFVTSHLGTVRRRLEQFREQVPPIPASAEDHWERAQIRLKEMGVGLERIADLVIKLRTFSRLDEGEWKCVRISECIDSLLTILSYRLEGRIEVVKQFSPPEAIECFPGLLNQALMNLVANSIDAIEGPGVVEITAGADGPDYVLRIADTGTGIDPAIQERVVEPFFTTKPVGKGTGLGLSITYSIIKKHEGTLELKPRAEGGTEAVIRMPLRLPSA